MRFKHYIVEESNEVDDFDKKWIAKFGEKSLSSNPYLKAKEKMIILPIIKKGMTEVLDRYFSTLKIRTGLNNISKLSSSTVFKFDIDVIQFDKHNLSPEDDDIADMIDSIKEAANDYALSLDYPDMNDADDANNRYDLVDEEKEIFLENVMFSYTITVNISAGLVNIKTVVDLDYLEDYEEHIDVDTTKVIIDKSYNIEKDGEFKAWFKTLVNEIIGKN